MDTFRVIFLSIFGLLAIGGLVMFISIGSGSEDDNQLPAVTIWGEAPAADFNEAIGEINNARPEGRKLEVSYREVGENIEQELIREFAQNNTPDILLVRHDKLLQLRDFIQQIPLDLYSERTFKSGFVRSANIFWRSSGPLAIPFAVDPLIMYWNRNMFANAGFAQAPTSWQEIPEIVNKITERDFAGNIDTSAIAFGEYTNVTNAKAILSTLFLQTDNDLISRNNNGQLQPNLRSERQADGAIGGSLASALDFYTEFSDPSSQLYSWNRGLNTSRERFIAGNLSMYFGFTSEASRLRELNPNLNFGVAPIPQTVQDNRSVYGQVYGFGILRRTSNQQAVLQVIKELTSGENPKKLADAVGGVSARRADVSAGAADALTSVGYESALIAEVWPDPNPVETDSIFEDMINDITSGRQSISASLNRAQKRLADILRE